MNPRILRDFQRILSLIKAVAVLNHQAREADCDGRLIATLDDYQTVFDVLCESYAATVNDGLTEDVLGVIAAVKAQGGALNVTYNDVAKQLGWHRDKARRNALIAMANGWLINKQEKRRQSAILDIGAETPESRGLPTREKIQRALSPQKPCARAHVNTGAASGVRTPNAHAAHDAYVTGGTHDVRNDGAHAKPNENATCARAQPFRGGISGSVLEGGDGSDDPVTIGDDLNWQPSLLEPAPDKAGDDHTRSKNIAKRFI